MNYKSKRDELRIADLKNIKPGEWIPASVLSAIHWTGATPEDICYAGRLQEAQRFIENYFLLKEEGTKVLCVQRESGIAITIGEESSSILGNRAVNAVRRLKQVNNDLEDKVDLRYMTPDQRRRHEIVRRRVQLQAEAIEHAKAKHTSEQNTAKLTTKQLQSVKG